MRKKATSIIIKCLILFLPLSTIAVEPSSVVFTQYKESYTIHEDNHALVVLTFTTKNPIGDQLLLPLSINNVQKAVVNSTSNKHRVAIITIDQLVYLDIKPMYQDIVDDHTISVSFDIKDFISETGLFYRKKTMTIPLLSNFPGNGKNNVFIDSYRATITIPENYNPEPWKEGKSSSEYKIIPIKYEHQNEPRILKIAAANLNLLTIKHEIIPLSGGFNPIILSVIIIGLVALYLFYFSNLMRFKESDHYSDSII